MLYYNRQIIYIDYMETGNKVKNAGFLKREETEDTITWNMQIKGLYETDTGFFDLRDETGAMIDKILLKRGTGSYERQFAAGDVSRGGRDFREICGITIRLSPGREVVGRWKGGEECLKAADITVTEQKTRELETPPLGTARYEQPQENVLEILQEAVTHRPEEQHMEILKHQKPSMEKERDTEAADDRSGSRLSGNDMESVMENGSLSAEKLCRRCMHKRFTPQEKKQEPDSKKAGPAAEGGEDLMKEEFFEDKWEQLCHMYPTVHPFADERQYLSITPGDFVILGSEYQKMVRNSFLLHGYYNYRHIILGKFQVGGAEKFYLGVPGVYYDREKMAAEMFGFEAFEGKQTPAEPGSFGYYMKSVRI